MSSVPNGRLTFSGLSRGKTIPLGTSGASFGVARWPTDPVGQATVTFSGVKAGTEIRVYLPNGTEVAGVESCDANHVLSWPVYASGSPNNVFRISLLSLNYKNEDFDYTASVGHQSIPIQPKPDKWYSNP